MKRLPGARASGEELLARLLGVGALIALSTAVVAGCVNVYVQPAPTTGGFVPLGTPFQPASPRPRITGQPGPTPVSSFTFTGTGPGEVTAALGDKPYSVTLTVTGGGCGIVFEDVGSAKVRAELGLEAPTYGDGWLWVAAELGGHTVRSASAVMQYHEEYVNDPPAGWEQSLAGFLWPLVAIRVAGDCPTWEIRGERKG